MSFVMRYNLRMIKKGNKLFEIGFKNDTLCYLKNLKMLSIIFLNYNNGLNFIMSSCLEIDFGPIVLLNSKEIFDNTFILS